MSVRLFVFLVLALVAMLAFFLVLVATDTALSVWQRLADAPVWAQLIYGLTLFVVASTTTWLAWRWLRPRSKPVPRRTTAPLDDASLQEALIASAGAGVDVDEALAELNEQRRRRQAGEVHIAMFGEVSAGKSTLVKALVPGVERDSDPRAGTTRDIRRFSWTSGTGDRVLITDLPGFNLDEPGAALDEARRAHLVVFLCDADLSDSEHRQLRALEKLGKPLIVALNKSDRFSPDERQLIIGRINEQTGIAADRIVAVQAGGREEILRELGDGRRESAVRERPADISALTAALQRELDRNLDVMESLRDTAVLQLASEKLDHARLAHRETEAQELVTRYSRRAVVGALAAVAPGSDLVIQGALATRLVQELCQLYEVPVKEVQIEEFLKLAGGRLRKFSAITFAIAGNALKAFPGVGTLSGGLLHAVAYGLIFDSLGRAAAQTLASRGELRPYPAVRAFEDLLRENLEKGAGRFAKLAVSQRKPRDPS